ncbi:MAG: PH domain-containing protein [Pseudohongiellaceae bacterium]|nr:PH domain-containing protein [Pseudohongiellaceae bacterium]
MSIEKASGEASDSAVPQAFSNNEVLLDHEYRLAPLVQIPMVGSRLFICSIAVGLVMFFGLGIPQPFLDQYLYHPSVFWLVPIAFVMWPLLAYRFWSYQLRKFDIIVKSGMLIRREISIPWSRIQQVDSRAGPLDRLCGLKRLVLHSAGSRAGRTLIPGIELKLAEALQKHLAQIVEQFHGSKTERLAQFRQAMKARKEAATQSDKETPLE